MTIIRAVILEKHSRCEQSPGMAKSDLTQNYTVLQYREALTKFVWTRVVNYQQSWKLHTEKLYQTPS